MDKTLHLGFPVPLLGMQPVRLPILFDDGELLALPKPAGVLVQPDPWYPKLPTLVDAIRFQARDGKPELQRLNIGPEGLWAVTDLDPECYGAVLFSRQRQVAEEMKSSLGSGNFSFSFKILSQGGRKEDSFECDLPLARHRDHKRVLVSHTTGKRTLTRFSRVEKSGNFQEWELETPFPRRHQLLVHPLEKGLPVLGDARYARENPVLLSRLKRNYQYKRDVDERPLYDGPAYFLEQIRVSEELVISCPEPPKWRGLIKQLAKCSQA